MTNAKAYSDQIAELTQRAEAAERERDQWAAKWKTSLDTYGENLTACGEEIDSLRRDRDVLMGQLGNTKINLEAAEKALAEARKDTERLVRLLARLAPETGIEHQHRQGGDTCVWCHSGYSRTEPEHTEDCPWTEARAAIDAAKEIS